MEDPFLLFENYITGNLSPQQQEAFEVQLQNDSSLHEDFINYKETYRLLEQKFKNNHQENDFKQNVEKISANYFKQKTSSKNKFWYLGVAASIALLIGVFLNNSKTPTYSEFITYPEVSFTERSAENVLFKDAENAFNKKDFKTANTAFSALLKNEPDNSEMKLYKGLSLIELNNFKEADQILTELTQGKTSYKTQAIWYLALSKLKQKKYTVCKVLLNKIPKHAVFYKKAMKLRSKLPE